MWSRAECVSDLKITSFRIKHRGNRDQKIESSTYVEAIFFSVELDVHILYDCQRLEFRKSKFIV